jgi:plasmid stability protein
MEAEAREILKRAIASDQPAPERGLGSRIHELFRGNAGVELELPERAVPRDVPDFSD